MHKIFKNTFELFRGKKSEKEGTYLMQTRENALIRLMKSQDGDHLTDYLFARREELLDLTNNPNLKPEALGMLMGKINEINNILIGLYSKKFENEDLK